MSYMSDIDILCQEAGIDPDELEAYREEEAKKGHTITNHVLPPYRAREGHMPRHAIMSPPHFRYP
jgi:hypothetical protein